GPDRVRRRHLSGDRDRPGGGLPAQPHRRRARMGAPGRGRDGPRLSPASSAGIARGRTDRLRKSVRRSVMPYEALFAETVYMRGHQNDQIDAYLARPLGGGRHAGVVVIHHMPGWDGPTKEIARRFAHHGYVTISPNLHFREGKATPEENSASIRAAGGMPDERTMGDVQGAVDSLRTLPYLNGKVGIVG